ncbi:BglII/BstYI family type II restriction endonuclease [Exiguobacterium flavidum]|uniref:BglII/BstYI family type II restriction endonuclease n=1 Tax=Exiguobacterium flavidum TaxID=2184695 RepID=UPI000DF73A3B|nr:BglII/BstYI family type II restriction endonuclease [Exiguobacterium flavidum]
MNYRIHSHRHGLNTLENDVEFKEAWEEVRSALHNITDEMIIEYHEQHYITSNKSISKTLTDMITKQLLEMRWKKGVYIFKEERYQDKTWQLDFMKDSISLEVGFNHGGTIAWNLMKPVLAAESNQVGKTVQAKVGIVICATNELRNKGGFDGAIGTFEKYVDHLKPLHNQLTVPLVIIGLEKPESFFIEVYKESQSTKRGRIRYYER